MKQHLLPALRLTLLSFLLVSVAYPLLIWAMAQGAPEKGTGIKTTMNGRTIGYQNEGQRFTEDRYFCSRPSAVNYNAAGSGGSNKGPSNPEYLAQVQARIDSFLAHNSQVRKGQIPAELVTASGSGLDPDLSPEAALVQIPRIAATRSLPEAVVRRLLQSKTQPALAGIFGPSKVNVLELNKALDELQTGKK